MDIKQREICVKLFQWNVNKPMLPRMKVCVKANEYAAEYEKFLKDKNDYLLTLDAEFEKYPVVKYEMHTHANKLMEEQIQEATKISSKRAIKELNPFLSTAIKHMHYTFQSMLATQEQVLDCCNHQNKLGHTLLDIKNEHLIPMSTYIHSASLYASDLLDTVFKELIDILDALVAKNKEIIQKLIEMFTNNVDKYESLSAGLGLEGTIYVIELDDNGYAYIKEQPFDMSLIEGDINRIWSLI
jgi:hypothetical protein